MDGILTHWLTGGGLVSRFVVFGLDGVIVALALGLVVDFGLLFC